MCKTHELEGEGVFIVSMTVGRYSQMLGFIGQETSYLSVSLKHKMILGKRKKP